MTALRSRLRFGFLALVPVTMAAVGAGCGAAAELQTNEPDAQERAVTSAALLDELALEGALLDDSPAVQLVSVATPSSSSTRIAETFPRVPRPLDKLLRAWGAPIPRSCATVEGAVPDADNDGIPATASVHLDCSSPAYAVHGTAFLIDDNDRDPASGFALGLRALRVESGTGQDALTRIADGSFLTSLRPNPSPGAVDMKVNARIETTRTASDGVVLDAVSVSSGTTTYFPDADLTPATRSRHGSVTSTVHTTIAFGGVEHTWTRRAASSLHWNLSCRDAGSTLSGFDGGGVLYTDERGNALRVDFVSCGTWNVTLNGRP